MISDGVFSRTMRVGRIHREWASWAGLGWELYNSVMAEAHENWGASGDLRKVIDNAGGQEYTT